MCPGGGDSIDSVRSDLEQSGCERVKMCSQLWRRSNGEAMLAKAKTNTEEVKVAPVAPKPKEPKELTEAKEPKAGSELL